MRRVFLILLLLILLSGIFLWQERQTLTQTQHITPTSAPLPTSKKIAPAISVQETPKVVTQQFYNRYLTCLKEPPVAAHGTVSRYCQVNTGLTTQHFAEHIKAGGVAQAGADPITCSQNPPQQVSVINATAVENGMARTTVNEAFGEMEEKISITLKVEDDTPKVDAIICPKP